MSDSGQDAIALTRQLIRMDTINPPGNEHVPAHFLGELLQKAGFTVAYHSFEPARTSLVARYGSHGAAKPICFSGHLDTVPLGAAAWDFAPHGGEIIDDRLYGRGSSDMKAGIGAFVAAALEHVRRAARTANLVLVLTASEETGCQGANHLANTEGALGDAGAVIIGEPTANYPVIGHKGVLWLRARMRGVNAHGSTPEFGVNAIYRARRVIEKLEKFRFNEAQHEVLGSPTLSVGTMRSGTNINSVPDLAELGIDVRTIPGIDNDELHARLSDYLAPELAELDAIIDIEPIYTAPEVPWIQRVYDIVTPFIAVRPEPRGASYFTDACALKRVYRAPTVILGPGEPNLAHQTNEFCTLSRIVQAVDIYGALMRDWCDASQRYEALHALDRVN
jgi:succinyl-diaminopimelate desuccinylase